MQLLVTNTNSWMYTNRLKKKSFLNLADLCKFFQLGLFVGGFLNYNCEDDILKKSARKKK